MRWQKPWPRLPYELTAGILQHSAYRKCIYPCLRFLGFPCWLPVPDNFRRKVRSRRSCHLLSGPSLRFRSFYNVLDASYQKIKKDLCDSLERITMEDIVADYHRSLQEGKTDRSKQQSTGQWFSGSTFGLAKTEKPSDKAATLLLLFSDVGFCNILMKKGS